jgi:hypothetical protein
LSSWRCVVVVGVADCLLDFQDETSYEKFMQIPKAFVVRFC